MGLTPTPVETPTFDEWLVKVFDHPELPEGWYFDDAEIERGWDGGDDPRAALAYQTRLFEDPTILLGRFSRQQIGHGLNYLMFSGVSSHLSAFLVVELPLVDRVRGVRAVGSLFEKLFARLIDPKDTAFYRQGAPIDGPTDMLTYCCFMWWDVWIDFAFGLARPDLSDVTAIAGECYHPDLVMAGLDAMRQSLATGHDPCIESALHGLGHWQSSEPDAVVAIIDAFLESRPDLHTKLYSYAMQAREGVVH